MSDHPSLRSLPATWRAQAAWHEREARKEEHDGCSLEHFMKQVALTRCADELDAALLAVPGPEPYDAEHEAQTLFHDLLKADHDPAKPRYEMALAFLRMWANSYLLKGNYWDVPQTMGSALNQVIKVLETQLAVPGPSAPEGQRCSGCVHLSPFELTDDLFTCPVVNIRIHRESADIFSCNQWEAPADARALPGPQEGT